MREGGRAGEGVGSCSIRPADSPLIKASRPDFPALTSPVYPSLPGRKRWRHSDICEGKEDKPDTNSHGGGILDALERLLIHDAVEARRRCGRE